MRGSPSETPIKAVASALFILSSQEYYSTLKRKGFLIYAITWMHLEGIKLSELSQLQKVKYCLSPLI